MQEANITEKSKINVNIATAWGVIVAVVSATIYMTIMITDIRYKIERLYLDNQRMQIEMVDQIRSVSDAQKQFVLKTKLEDLLILTEKNRRQMTVDEEMTYRRFIRDMLGN